MTSSVTVDHIAALEAIGRAEWLLAEAARLLVEPTLAAALADIDDTAGSLESVYATRRRVNTLWRAFTTHQRSTI